MAKIGNMNMEINQKQIKPIKCPHCGWEYHACEIFYPGELLGKTKTIIRDPLGKILYTEWEEDNLPETTEKFTCNNCDNDFLIESVVTCKAVELAEELNFKKQTVSLLD